MPIDNSRSRENSLFPQRLALESRETLYRSSSRYRLLPCTGIITPKQESSAMMSMLPFMLRSFDVVDLRAGTKPISYFRYVHRRPLIFAPGARAK